MNTSWQPYTSYVPTYWNPVVPTFVPPTTPTFAQNGGIFGVPITGGGSISFGNQTIPGNVWMWAVAALVIVFLVARS